MFHHVDKYSAEIHSVSYSFHSAVVHHLLLVIAMSGRFSNREECKWTPCHPSGSSSFFRCLIFTP